MRIQKRQGFTLIELLVVIAILLVLIAIALPNFLESLMRAKVTKTKGELRTLQLALQSYFIDWKFYPSESEAEYTRVGHFEAGLTWLTSPIAYLGQLPMDPFQGEVEGGISYELGGVEVPFQEQVGGLLAMWVLHSYGPDSPQEENKTSRPNYKDYDDERVNSYSPTNGLNSRGDIAHYGGDPAFMGVVIDFADKIALRDAPRPGLIVDGTVYLGRFPPE